jgi:hypothetical protein
MSNQELNAEQVAAMTGLAVSSVLRWIRRGELKTSKDRRLCHPSSGCQELHVEAAFVIQGWKTQKASQ